MKIIIRTKAHRCMLDTTARTRQCQQVIHKAVTLSRIRIARTFIYAAEHTMPRLKA